MGSIVRYIHHGRKVFVDIIMKGNHKHQGLCYRCRKFHPERTCNVAAMLTAFHWLSNVLTVVWECPDFEEKE